MHCWFVASSGASDVGSGSSHVHPVRHWCVPGANHLHEEFGRQPTRQEEQEAAGLHLPHQKWGRSTERLVQSAILAVRGWRHFVHHVLILTWNIITFKLVKPPFWPITSRRHDDNSTEMWIFSQTKELLLILENRLWSWLLPFIL